MKKQKKPVYIYIPEYDWGGAVRGGTTGLTLGTTLGSLAGPWGTAIGAVGGALIGGVAGYFADDSDTETVNAERMAEKVAAYNATQNRSRNISKTNKGQSYMYGPTIAKKGGTIHIKPENKGKFNALKKRTGKSTEELTHSKNPLTRKRAIFAQNARKWKHPDGGPIDPTTDPVMVNYYKMLGYGYYDAVKMAKDAATPKPHTEVFPNYEYTGYPLKEPSKYTKATIESPVENFDEVRFSAKLNTNKMYGGYRYGGMFPLGGQMVPAEIEKEEVVQTPDGQLMQAQLPSHEQAANIEQRTGTNPNQGMFPEDSRVFSDTLKYKGKTYAELAEKIMKEPDRYAKLMKKDHPDVIRLRSLGMMMDRAEMTAQQKLDELFARQEASKSKKETTMCHGGRMTIGGLTKDGTLRSSNSQSNSQFDTTGLISGLASSASSILGNINYVKNQDAKADQFAQAASDMQMRRMSLYENNIVPENFAKYGGMMRYPMGGGMGWPDDPEKKRKMMDKYISENPEIAIGYRDIVDSYRNKQMDVDDFSAFLYEKGHGNVPGMTKKKDIRSYQEYQRTLSPTSTPLKEKTIRQTIYPQQTSAEGGIDFTTNVYRPPYRMPATTQDDLLKQQQNQYVPQKMNTYVTKDRTLTSGSGFDWKNQDWSGAVLDLAQTTPILYNAIMSGKKAEMLNPNAYTVSQPIEAMMVSGSEAQRQADRVSSNVINNPNLNPAERIAALNQLIGAKAGIQEQVNNANTQSYSQAQQLDLQRKMANAQTLLNVQGINMQSAANKRNFLGTAMGQLSQFAGKEELQKNQVLRDAQLVQAMSNVVPGYKAVYENRTLVWKWRGAGQQPDITLDEAYKIIYGK